MLKEMPKAAKPDDEPTCQPEVQDENALAELNKRKKKKKKGSHYKVSRGASSGASNNVQKGANISPKPVCGENAVGGIGASKHAAQVPPKFSQDELRRYLSAFPGMIANNTGVPGLPNIPGVFGPMGMGVFPGNPGMLNGLSQHAMHGFGPMPGMLGMPPNLPLAPMMAGLPGFANMAGLPGMGIAGLPPMGMFPPMFPPHSPAPAMFGLGGDKVRATGVSNQSQKKLYPHQ